MAVSTSTKVIRDGIVTLYDGTGTPQTLEIVVDQGELSFTVPRAEDVQVLHRDQISGGNLREGPDRPVEGSLSLAFRTWYGTSGTSPESPAEWFLFRSGLSLVSTGASGDADMLGLRVDHNDRSAVKHERLTFAKCRFRDLEYRRGNPCTLSVNFTDWEVEPASSTYTP